MEERTFVITGATGNIGHALAEKLLAGGHKVRALARSAERLKPLADKGAEPFIRELEDADFLTRAFRGAKAVFAMIPPNPTAPDWRAYQNRISESLASATRQARVAHVVTLSSIGAHLPVGTGPIAGLYDNEQRFDRLEGVNVLHVRPTFFMENLLSGIDIIKNMGVNGSPQAPELPMPMIATKDIAACIAPVLERADFEGKSVLELLGNSDVTMVEATRTLGEAIGKPDLRYVQFPYADTQQALLGMGLSQSVADSYIEMYRGFNEGTVRPTEERSPANTTPTTLEEFAREVFAPAYQRGGAAAFA
ncbi:MAG: NAD(P)H-binding protein [Acidobacteriota bacterium]|nr:NAD(P)H-binding protein [Acidobacteriota bacterium]